MTAVTYFVDQTPSAAGTPLNAANLNQALQAISGVPVNAGTTTTYSMGSGAIPGYRMAAHNGYFLAIPCLGVGGATAGQLQSWETNDLQAGGGTAFLGQTPAGVISSTGTQPTAAAPYGRFVVTVAQGNARLQVWDVSNRVVYGPVASMALQGAGTDIAIVGRYACVAEPTVNKVEIIDLTQPLAPQSVGTLSTSLSSPQRLCVFGGAYLAIANGGSATVALYAVPTTPALGGSPLYVLSGAPLSAPYDVCALGRYLAISDSGAGKVLILDVANPASPTIVSTIVTPPAPGPIAVAGRFIAVGCRTASAVTQLIDVGRPTAPALSTAIPLPASSGPSAVSFVGRYVATACNNSSSGNVLVLCDLTGVDLAAARIDAAALGTATVEQSLTVAGRTRTAALQVGAGGATIDGDLSAPDVDALYGAFPSRATNRGIRQVGAVATTGQPQYGWSLFQGSYLLVPTGPGGATAGIDVLDLSTRAAPVKVGHTSWTTNNGLGAALPCVLGLGRSIWAGEGDFGHIDALDGNNVTATMTIASNWFTGGGTNALAQVGRSIVSLSANSGPAQVHFIDIAQWNQSSNNTAPFVNLPGTSAGSVGDLCSFGTGYLVAASGGLSSGTGGNSVYLINASLQSVVATLANSSYLNGPHAMALYGAYLYVVNAATSGTAANQIAVLNVSNPGSVQYVGLFGSLSSALGKALVAGHYLFVANTGANTVLVYDLKASPTNPPLVATLSGFSSPVGLFVAGAHLYVGNQGTSQVLVYDLSSLDIAAARIGALAAGQVLVERNLDVGGATKTQGLVVGPRGAVIEGDLYVGGYTPVFSVSEALYTSGGGGLPSPTAAYGSSWSGTNGSIAIFGSDVAGTVLLNWGQSSGGFIAQINFGTPRPGQYPRVWLQKQASNGAPGYIGQGLYVRPFEGAGSLGVGYGFYIGVDGAVGQINNPIQIYYHVEW